MNTIQAQTDEEFLAEAFFDYMNDKSDKVYVDINCSVSSMSLLRVDIDYQIFREKLNILDTTIVDELHDYYNNLSGYCQKWNAQASVFQTLKYKQLKFIESDLKGHHKRTRYIAKPLFTKNREYALVSETFFTYHKLSWKYRLKNGLKTKYQVDISAYNILFKKEGGKWVIVGKYVTLIS